MDGEAYAVIYIDKFAGNPVAEQLREGIRRRFHLKEAMLARLSCGGPVVVKRWVDFGEAERYRAAIQAVGGVCWIQALNAAGEVEERRKARRRRLLDRRLRYRGSSILPDRRSTCGRRSSDL